MVLHPSIARSLDFKRWKLWILVLAAHGKSRRERLAYERFLELAPQVQEALEHFAADHNGQFPSDAMMTSRPAGLTDKYIKWRKSWKIDYEVHDNDKDGQSVCLEFCGPFDERLYCGLCKSPEHRRFYGRGQPIHGHVNRIWAIRENASIMEEPLPESEKQEQPQCQSPQPGH